MGERTVSDNKCTTAKMPRACMLRCDSQLRSPYRTGHVFAPQPAQFAMAPHPKDGKGLFSAARKEALVPFIGGRPFATMC